MKKILGIISAVVMVVLLLTGCTSNQAIKEVPAEPSPTPEKNEITVSILTGDVVGRNKQYFKVSGLADSEVEDALNSDLFLFSAWDGIEDYTLDFAVVGNFLSVRRAGTQNTEGSAYPTNFLQTQIFDLSTGKQAGSLADFVRLDKDILDNIEDGIFKLVYPEEIKSVIPIDDVNERLYEEIVNNHARRDDYFDMNFYLTETSLGLFIETLHAEGDYWVFEATYEAIRPILSEKLLAALK